MECRLERARDRLSVPTLADSVTDVALECGFRDLSHFAAKYHEKYGEPPSETLRAAQQLAYSE
jgi:transcriptional regulator GlxA family with amidase domain